MQDKQPSAAGVVLCGGLSRRMGLAKADLPFGPETMLQRVVRRLLKVVTPVVVVAAKDQVLPSLPSDIRVVRDRNQNRGPLEGLATGLSALEGEADLAYATGCDVPMLVPEFVQRMITLARGYEIVVPFEGRFHHPLSAIYRVRLVPTIERLLASDRMRPQFLFDEVNTLRVNVEQLREADPTLQTLANLNHPEDYLAAIKQAGFEAPAEVLAQIEHKPPTDQ